MILSSEVGRLEMARVINLDLLANVILGMVASWTSSLWQCILGNFVCLEDTASSTTKDLTAAHH